MYKITEIREMSAPIFAKYGVGRVLLFGSYARGDADETSDLDFYMEEGGDVTSLLEISGLYLDFEEVFSCQIDLLSGKIRDAGLYANICREGIIIYENKEKCSDYPKDH